MKKNKHDHKGTKALKLSIFFTLMLTPFFAVLFKCAYVTFNKNAKDSYSDTYVENVDKLNTNDLIANNSYIFTYRNGTTISDYSPQFYYTDININWSNYSNFNNSQVGGFRFYPETSTNVNQKIALYQSDGTYLGLTNNVWGSSLTTFTIKYTESRATNNNQPLFDLYFVTYQTNKLDNAFYYAIDEAMDSQYFAWARTSALYTATSGLTNGLGITTQAIPTLLVYWLILTTIYIVFDIVIESFTYLTHMITSRFE